MKKILILGIVLALLLIPAVFAQVTALHPEGGGDTTTGVAAGAKAGATGAVRPTYTDYGPDKTRSLTDLPKIVAEPPKTRNGFAEIPSKMVGSSGRATENPAAGTDITSILPMILGVIGVLIVVVLIAIKIK